MKYIIIFCQFWRICECLVNSQFHIFQNVFIPFGLNDNDHVSGLSDVNPYFSVFSSYSQVGAKCNYYLKPCFNEEIAQNEWVKIVFFVCPANIRNVSKNLKNLEIYLNIFNYEFTMVSLTETWLQNMT